MATARANLGTSWQKHKLMLGGMPITDIEETLSTALTASMRIPAAQRPAFISELLVNVADGMAAADAVRCWRGATLWLDPPPT